MEQVAIIGAGAWGTALSLLLANKGYRTSIWVWDSQQAQSMLSTRINPLLPGHGLPDSVHITTSISDALISAEAVIFVTISQAAADVAMDMKEHLKPNIPIISATKGLNCKTGLTMSQTLKSILSPSNPIAAISGPNLAMEIAAGVPSATVAASEDASTAKLVQSLLMSPSLRVYTNSDIIGVELAGALKNILAIGAGICDGLGYGNNTKAALLTRGLAEITRLGMKLGAQRETFMGLAGIGDIITTCASPLSRNRRVGQGLGEGRRLDDILADLWHVAEGIPTTKAAYELAQKTDTPMPITEQIYEVVYNSKSPMEAVYQLMNREPRAECW
jgi:glycerol-3-phosphate dehydrogenase (NAD(P)+)